MLAKGDLKFRLQGEKLKGEFVLAHMRSRRPGSKGTEWLLIKKKDEAVQPGFNVDKLDYSVLTDRSLDEIASDEGSAEWQSNRKAVVRKGAEWLQDSLSRAGKKRAPVKSAAKKKSVSKKVAVKKNSSRKPLKTKTAKPRRAA
jgi:bifunctional non-homologous end joining protein LigD